MAVSHLINGMNERRLVELIKSGETDEFISYFPEYKSAIDAIIKQMNNVADYLKAIIQAEIDNKTFSSRKQLAELAQKTLFPAFLFLYYDGEIKNPLEWLRSLTSDKILEYIGRL